MMFRTRLFVLLCAGLFLALLAVPASALAHERRTIANGKYDVVVGWDQEPAYVGQKNGATIRISQAGSNPAVPVEGADKTLKVSIKQGASTRDFPLRAVFGQPGYYMADIFPTRVGDYQWTFTGTIRTSARARYPTPPATPAPIQADRRPVRNATSPSRSEVMKRRSARPSPSVSWPTAAGTGSRT